MRLKHLVWREPLFIVRIYKYIEKKTVIVNFETLIWFSWPGCSKAETLKISFQPQRCLVSPA